MTCEEIAHYAGISRPSAYRILTERLHKCRIAARWVNAQPQLGKDARELLDRYSWEVLCHPPYSPNMSPPDFDLFTKLKINMHGVRFSTLEDLSASVTQRVRQLNCSTDLTGIMDLPKCWDAVIQQKGDYTLPHIWCSIL